MAEIVRSAAPDLTNPERPASRFPLFDGFRAIAAVSVLLTHVAFDTGYDINSSWGRFFARADVGVAVFFLISGFLLYRPFVAARFRGEPRPKTGAFLWRRALRIYPAYWVALVAIVAFTPIAVHGLANWLRFIGLVHIYWPTTVFGPVAQSWTLATELAFYLFLPLYAYAQRRTTRDDATQEHKLRAELVGLGVLVVVTWGYRLWLWSLHSDRFGVYNTWLPSWLDHFALGMLLAVGSVWVAERRRAAPFALDRRWAPAVCWLVSGLAFWTVCTRLGVAVNYTLFTVRDEMVVHVFYAIVAFFLLLPGVFGSQRVGVIRRLLANRVVQLLGLVSYGIYLFHELWIIRLREWAGAPKDAIGGNFGKLAIGVFACTLVVAALSYVLVERPLLRRKNVVPRLLRR
ncbi:MAG TPA: acyltransferase [Acidimicrobiales bacterium]|nr:acyltransferase [Acidimicrobiales bacterium]